MAIDMKITVETTSTSIDARLKTTGAGLVPCITRYSNIDAGDHPWFY